MEREDKERAQASVRALRLEVEQIKGRVSEKVSGGSGGVG